MKSAQKILNSNDALPPDAVREFIEEFTKWTNESITKKYSDDYLIGAIYKENVFFTTEEEYTQLCKCQIALASRCLRDLITEVECGKIKEAELKVHIFDYIFDLKPYVEQVARKTKPEYIFIEGWKSYKELSFVKFIEARALFCSGMVADKNPISLRGTIILLEFALRQLIELHFMRALGIFKIIDENGNDAKLRHNFILVYLAHYLDLISIKIGSMCELYRIYKWTNYSIHTGSMPKIWEVQFAFDYCWKAFQPEPLNPKDGWNINSSITIKNYPELKRRFEQDVNDNLKGRNWQFLYMNKPEAVIQ